MEVSIFEVLFFLTLLVYTAPHIMVFGAVNEFWVQVLCESAFIDKVHIIFNKGRSNSGR